jgi:hypothetical protein
MRLGLKLHNSRLYPIAISASKPSDTEFLRKWCLRIAYSFGRLLSQNPIMADDFTAFAKDVALFSAHLTAVAESYAAARRTEELNSQTDHSL